jgi:hypothetical protein
MGASVGMVGLGAAATAYALHRREAPAIPAAFGYFTAMEALQVAGHAVVDRCGSPTNQAVTLLSYLHIAFQPFFINAFAMAIRPRQPKPAIRWLVWGSCALVAATMLLQVYPFEWAGACIAGATLCGTLLCTASGEWHIAWSVPYNAIVPPIELWDGFRLTFPGYMAAAFVLPLFYGAWRFVLFHLLAGPGLASLLTSDPREMPAIWCLFSIGLLLVGLVPRLRRLVGGAEAAVSPARGT